MPRRPRGAVDDGIYHVLNRGNCRMDLFETRGDFEAFIGLLEQGRERFSMRILGYCLMPNHWHLVLWPRRGRDLSAFVGWVSNTHVRRWREHRRTVGQGHLYQGRFKSFLIQRDEHLLTGLRYVEANPCRAKLASRAEDYPWSSVGRAPGTNGVMLELHPWPVERPADWLEWVNARWSEQTLEKLRLSVSRGRPFGDEKWTLRTARRHDLLSTLRDPWRPKRSEPETTSARR
jgi:putative transposase